MAKQLGGNLQRESRKHHYVPQSLLEYFSIDKAGKQIHVFDKYRSVVFPSSIKDAGSQNDFNKLKAEKGCWNFESIFSEVDGRLASLLKQIHQVRDISALTAGDRRDWADMVAVQLLRTPIMRTTIPQLAADIVSFISENGMAKPEDFSMPTDNDSRRNMVKMFQNRESLRAALEGKDFVLFEGDGSVPFLISDHPVVRQSTVPHGDIGLSSPGVGIYLPLGPNLVLAMLCKSARKTLNDYPVEVLKTHQVALREGLRTGQPVRWAHSAIASFNALQVAGSSRFLYGPQDAFDAVRAMLDAHPKWRHVKSNLKIGKMGDAPPPNNRMPEGRWLVLVGQSNQYMLSIQHWRAEQYEAETHDIEMLIISSHGRSHAVFGLIQPCRYSLILAMKLYSVFVNMEILGNGVCSALGSAHWLSRTVGSICHDHRPRIYANQAPRHR